ncbi:hypothetical protein NP493_668g01054 [Ridgeia piscesae]|uniref:Phosphatidylinositol N-acetylglucosaminyltransferase subunit C n=1 Tax=Ridgeia piscesae TaxID=27915 RepID=A0AAD9KRU9_RIDPI|nr:hypothetical protein NP493_668g01054 [Ridgeia piscesae]
MERKIKWKKILYEDQGVPDNFVDDTFLEELKKNLNTRTYHFWPVVVESGVVTQQVSSICLFVVMFRYMQLDWLSPQWLFAGTLSLAVTGYILNELVDRQNNKTTGRTRWDDVKTVFIFVAFGYGLSPVFMTLTDTISTDTIYAMTAFMLLSNLLFHDYGADAALVSQSLSLNAAMFASVCLASRLTTTVHAFATITFAVEMFALWPMLRRKLKKNVVHSQAAMTAVLGVSAAVAIYTLSGVSALLFVIVHLFITFVCPAWLIKLQDYKE